MHEKYRTNTKVVTGNILTKLVLHRYFFKNRLFTLSIRVMTCTLTRVAAGAGRAHSAGRQAGVSRQAGRRQRGCTVPPSYLSGMLLLAALAGVAAVAAVTDSSPPARPTFGYSWDRISTYAFPGHMMGGNLTAAEVTHFSKFSLLLYWGIDLRTDPSKGPGCKGCYFLVFVQLFEKYGTLIERNTELIEKVSPCRVRSGPGSEDDRSGSGP
eukprot:SAG31_NODE_575_length_13961_cov_41.577550_9_plen_211_part_00